MVKYSDEQLTAFLDGELPKAHMQAIERAIQTDAELSVRLASLHMDTGGLKSIFDGWLGKAPREKLREMMPALTTQGDDGTSEVIIKRQWGLMAAAAAVALGIGFWLGHNSVHLPPVETDWVSVVAAEQANDQPTGVDYANYRKAAALVTQLGEEMTHERLRLTGLTLHSSDLLLMNGYRLVHLGYVDKSNAPIGIYLLRTGAVQTQRDLITPSGLYGLYWAHRGVEIAILGDTNPQFLQSVADQFDRALIPQ